MSEQRYNDHESHILRYVTAGMLMAGLLAAVAVGWMIVAVLAHTDREGPSYRILAAGGFFLLSLFVGMWNHSRAAKRWSS